MKLHVVLAILGVVLLTGCATTLTEHQLANRILGLAGPRSCRLYYAGSSEHYDHFAEYNVGSTRYRRYKVKKGLIAVPAPMPETKDLCFWRLCHLKRKAGPDNSQLKSRSKMVFLFPQALPTTAMRQLVPPIWKAFAAAIAVMRSEACDSAD